MRSDLRALASLALLATASCTSLARLSGIRGGALAPVQLIDPTGSLNQDAATELASGSSELALITSVGAKGRGRRLKGGLCTPVEALGDVLVSNLQSLPGVTLDVLEVKKGA